MWPLHARTKDEYIQLIENHLERGETHPLQDLLTQAFEDYDGEEDFAAWLAGVAHGSECPVAGTMLARFLERYPQSWHPIQVDWAEMLLRDGRIDEGSNEARAWLHRLQQTDLAHQVRENEMIRYGACRAFLILTAIYTEIAARSYSTRVLEYCLVMDLDGYWQRRLSMEYQRLQEELRQPTLARANAKWEAFFSSGEGREDLVTACQAKGFSLLAKRIDTLGEKFRLEPGFRMTEEEIFQLLYQTDKGAFVLY